MAITVFLGTASHAAENEFIEIRGKIFDEANELKALWAKSKDGVLVSSMWDSSIITVTQLDAYFYMIGIFNTVREENAAPEALNYLINWLQTIKKTTELNIKSLKGVSRPNEDITVMHIGVLKAHYGKLNKLLGPEIERLELLKKALP